MRYTIGERSQQLILSALLLADTLCNVVAMPSTIGRDAIRNMNGVPSLGRGYSVSTNSIMGSCLNSTIEEENHSNSYDFDCELHIFSTFGCLVLCMS